MQWILSNMWTSRLSLNILRMSSVCGMLVDPPDGVSLFADKFQIAIQPSFGLAAYKRATKHMLKPLAEGQKLCGARTDKSSRYTH